MFSFSNPSNKMHLMANILEMIDSSTRPWCHVDLGPLHLIQCASYPSMPSPPLNALRMKWTWIFWTKPQKISNRQAKNFPIFILPQKSICFYTLYQPLSDTDTLLESSLNKKGWTFYSWTSILHRKSNLRCRKNNIWTWLIFLKC